PSYRQYGQGFTLTRNDRNWFFGHYAPLGNRSSRRISPLRAEILSCQPPTFLATAEYDVLRSEGKAYANRLSDAGVPVVYQCYEGVTHGFIRLHNLVDVADRALTDISKFIIERCQCPLSGIPKP
ncbi:MAG: alpha/beta hydrolase fold domain-containing protein, partial [Phyllobacterium sp.]